MRFAGQRREMRPSTVPNMDSTGLNAGMAASPLYLRLGMISEETSVEHPWHSKAKTPPRSKIIRTANTTARMFVY